MAAQGNLQLPIPQPSLTLGRRLSCPNISLPCLPIYSFSCLGQVPDTLIGPRGWGVGGGVFAPSPRICALCPLPEDHHDSLNWQVEAGRRRSAGGQIIHLMSTGPCIPPDLQATLRPFCLQASHQTPIFTLAPLFLNPGSSQAPL